MGISKSAFRLLMEEIKKGNIKRGKILQLGRQHTFLTLSHAIDLAKRANFTLKNLDPSKIQLSFNPELQSLGYIDDVTLFSLLGFDQTHSLDVSSYEKATYAYDLNNPLPETLHQQYDVIFDGGTIEHVFSVPQALKNIHSLLKEGGAIIHASPSNNYVDHGFYMFSPTFFYEYYTANSYKILTSYIFESAFENNTAWHVYEYKPGKIKALSFGGFKKNMLGIWFIAQKQLSSTEGVIPQQGAYQPQWSSQPLSQQPPSLSFLRSWLKKFAFLRSVVLKIRKRHCQQTEKRIIKKNKVGIF